MNTLTDILDAAVRDHGPRPCAGGYTYAALRARVHAIAAALQARGVANGDRVLLCQVPGPDWLAALFAITRLGAAAVPLAPAAPASALAAAVAHASPRCWLGCEQTVPLLAAAAPALPGLVASTVTAVPPGGTTPPDAARPDGTALLAFTSGSTTNPRAVELTHANLASNLAGLCRYRQVAPGAVFLSLLPPTHLFELIVGELGPLTCGAHIVFSPTLMPNRILETIRDARITHVLTVPALLRILLDAWIGQLREAGCALPRTGAAPEPALLAALQSARDAGALSAWRQTWRRVSGERLQMVIVGGAAGHPDWGEIFRLLGLDLEVGYGLTEAGPIVSLGNACTLPRGSVGRPLPGVTVGLGPDEEILVRGPGVMRGYYGDPAASADALRGGWLHTGDRGARDAGQCLFITGRIKESMVNDAGETVYPDEVEPQFQDDAFAELCVVPFPGDDGNDVPLLVARPNGTRELASLRFRTLWRRACPRLRVRGMYLCTDPLLRTPTGKPRRRELANNLANKEGPWTRLHTSPHFVSTSGIS